MMVQACSSRISGAFLAAAALIAAVPARAQTADTVGPPLETVKTFGDDFRLVGIGVSHEGRVFATAPSSQVRSRYSMVEVDPKTGNITPYPNEDWNKFSENPGDRPEWISVQALWVDKANHLWALDCSLSNADQEKLPPKLVEFDLATNKEIRQYGFKGVITAQDSLNDVRVDAARGYAYLTNVAKKGSLVVLDLKTGVARNLLVGDRSTFADPNEHLMIKGEPALKMDGSVLVLHNDGIALSPDGDWLYYRPLTDHNYWRVPTAALRDTGMSPEELAKKVEFLGTGVMSGGLIMDYTDTLYGGDLEHSTIAAMTINPKDHTMTSKLFVKDPKLSWADGFAISGGYLYIADSRLWEVAFKNSLPRSGPFTIFKVKLPE
jgi:sugar lactone lactonase YvrE